MRMRVIVSLLAVVAAAAPAHAQDTASPLVAHVTVNGQAITSDLVEARQFDLIGKDTIVQTVLTESRQLSRTPAVAADLKSLLAAVVQEKPEASREEVMAIVQERSVAYTQTLAVRKVKPKLFAEVEQKATEELIDEQLMMQEAQREGISADEALVDKALEAVPRRAGAETEDLHKLLVAWDKHALPSARARIKAQLAWKAVLEKRLSGAGDKGGLEELSKAELAKLRQSAKLEKS